MDISNHDHKLPNSSWDVIQPFNMTMEAHHNMLDHHHHHHQQHETVPFDHTQWPNYSQNLPQHSNPSPTHLLPPENPSHQPGERFKLEIGDQEDGPEEELGAMKEMMFKIAAMQPVDIDPTTIRKPKRRNVRISDDPQSVAARHRRERISEKIRILQRLVPGGTKMDTASMLDEAIRYVKFLKRQIRVLQGTSTSNNTFFPTNGVHEVGPNSAGDEDWAGTSSYNVFGGNNNVNDGPNDHGPICFDNKFRGHD